ncbi:MAG: TatD family hydrolase [Terriglobia bacterium]
MLVDSHCHLDDEKFSGDLEAVIERARQSGVGRMLTIGTGDGPPGLSCAVEIADRFEPVYATVGVHPQDAAKVTEKSFDELRDLAHHPKVIALGEIGLDYHYDPSARERQRDVFIEQLKIAAGLNLPVIIHTRDAWDDTIAVLKEHWRGLGIIHCFTGNSSQAQTALELGFHLAFGGVLTFKTAEMVRDAARIVPDDRLLVETDAPYLAPVPWRGKRNEPAFIVETARALAAVRNTSPERIASITTTNFENLCLRPRNGNRYTEVSNGD